MIEQSLDIDQAQFPFASSQRWFAHRSLYRPSQEPFNPLRFGVEPIEYARGKAFVQTHHYSGTFTPALQCYGLFRKDSAHAPAVLSGVATFSPASNPASISRWTGLTTPEGAELSRFVFDGCLRRELGVVVPRCLPSDAQVSAAGDQSGPQLLRSRSAHDGGWQLFFPGHRGGIYQASNAFYFGRASPKTQFLNGQGKVVANRIFSKLRNGEVGRRYAERVLSDVAGTERLPDESAADFVARAMSLLRRQRHPGNHLFAFPVAADRREKRAILNLPVLRAHNLGVAQYPKRLDPVPVSGDNLSSPC